MGSPSAVTPEPGPGGGAGGLATELVDVAVAAPVAGLFSYRVPAALRDQVVVGSRVVVPFGGRSLAGVVVGPASAPPSVEPSPIRELADPSTSLPVDLVQLGLWIADYYQAPPGEVMRAALPAGTEVAAELWVSATDEGRRALDGGALPARRRDLLYRIVHDGPLAKRGLANVRRLLDELLAAGLCAVEPRVKGARARLRRVKVASLRPGVDLDDARQRLARAPRRLAVLELLAKASCETQALATAQPGAAAALRELVAAELVTIETRTALPGAAAVPNLPANVAPPRLTERQRAAVDAMTEALGQGFSATLLHGITGSGKTEVYLHVIAEALARGGSAIVLVPEISLTPQLAARFRARFGDEVAVLHSGLSERDRLGEWHRLHAGSARIALGARSAVFAPVKRLAVVVVDEEHDSSFKQDEGVRYHGRDVALVRAQRAGAVCILGSATPSLESFALAKAGRYRLVSLPERATPRPLPAVEIVDLRTYRPDGESMLSAPLGAAVAEALANADQVILFLNRRGFATFVLCIGCGHAFRCPHCAVSLTYHRHADRLMCHYCGYAARVVDRCPACKAEGTIERRGLGTEKIAAAIAERFPTARVGRLDRDVASGIKAEAVLARMARREIDILVGTQMVTKGHDFPGVTLVGILCADTGLSLPDFRASERTFQLLTQVAGRAGRGDRPGRVVLQTYRPDATAVRFAAGHDYVGFVDSELASRAELSYPPEGRLAAVRLDGADEHEVAAYASVIAEHARHAGHGLDVEVRGPVPAPLARLRGRSRWQIWLKARERGPLRQVLRAIGNAEPHRRVRVSVDVDPIAAL